MYDTDFARLSMHGVFLSRSGRKFCSEIKIRNHLVNFGQSFGGITNFLLLGTHTRIHRENHVP